MIDLTPLEVRKKKGDFRRVLRGYDGELVDDFLDIVADRLEELVRENLALNERVGRLEERVADYREREKALTEALVSAQELREERLTQATREADLRMREAEADAERIREAALRERQGEEEGLRRVRARRAQLMESLRAFLERELHQIDVESAALDLSDVTAEAAARVWELGPERKPSAPPPPRPVVGHGPPPSPAESPVDMEFVLGDVAAPREHDPLADDGPPITGDEEWLPLLDDER
jgi:cell division initiation protein